MKWTPDTHQISFEIENGIAVSFKTDVAEWKEISPQELHEMVLEEHQTINTLEDKTPDEIAEIKESILKGKSNLEDYGI